MVGAEVSNCRHRRRKLTPKNTTRKQAGPRAQAQARCGRRHRLHRDAQQRTNRLESDLGPQLPERLAHDAVHGHAPHDAKVGLHEAHALGVGDPRDERLRLREPQVDGVGLEHQHARAPLNDVKHSLRWRRRVDGERPRIGGGSGGLGLTAAVGHE